MTRETWTIFRRDGYTAGYEPRWTRVLCCGVRRGAVTVTGDPDGTGRSRLVLYIPRKGARIFDAVGNSIPFTQSGVQPGDMLTAGDTGSLGGGGGWRIRSVTPFCGMGGGWKITAG